MIPEIGYTSEATRDQGTRACMNMWAAVMIAGVREAADDFYKYKKTGKAGDALHWFFSSDPSIGSFDWLCELFSVHPDNARSNARAQFRNLARQQRSLQAAEVAEVAEVAA